MSSTPLAPATASATPVQAPASTWLSRLALAWKHLGTEWKLAIALLLSLRIGLGLIGLVSMELQPGGTLQGDWTKLLITHGKPWSYILSVWQRWDSLWYQQIATNGYHAGDKSVHFEPLYPLLARTVSIPLGGQVVVAQLLVSSAAFVLAMVLLYRLVRLDASPTTARLTVILTALFPTGFFLVAPYTESVYLLLTLAAVWFSRQGRPWLAGLAGFGVGLARWVGVFIACALVIEYIQQRRAAHRSFDLAFFAAGSPVIAIVAMMAYSRFVVGEHSTLLQSNDYWGVKLVAPWRTLSDSRDFITRTGSVTELFNLVCLVLFAVLVITGIKRLPLSYVAYAAPYLLLMVCRDETIGSPLLGVARYILVLFPCFIVAALWLRKRPFLAASTLVLATSLQVVLFLYWLHWGYLA